MQKAEEPLDEGELTRAHDNIYSKNDSRGITAQLLGSAAALNVCSALRLKMFLIYNWQLSGH